MPPARYAERLGRPDVDTAAERSEQTPAGTLVVGAIDDRAEVEADRVAAEVIGRLQDGAGPVHEHSTGCGHGDLRRSGRPLAGAEVGLEGGAVSTELSAQIEGKRGGGSALPDDVRGRMEQGFGGSLSDVRVHTDAESASLNRAVSARAFTTGSDIFFGSGEYQPDTLEGEQVLAHEIAHTRQAGGGARRTTIRRWNVKSKRFDWGKTRKIVALETGQPVYFFDDDTGDRLVIKAEKSKVGLNELGSILHENLSGVKAVHYQKLSGSDVNQVGAMLSDRNSPKIDRDSWSAVGAFNQAREKGREVVAEGETLFDVGARITEGNVVYWGDATWQAMDFAAGETAKKASGRKVEDAYAGTGEKNRLRTLLSDFKHVEELGLLEAVDIFFGNGDRVGAGNVGNWIYDPHGTAITVIDHVSNGVSTIYDKIPTQSNLEEDWFINELSESKLATAGRDWLVRFGAALSRPQVSNDLEFEAWIQSDPQRAARQAEAFTNGLRKGKALVVKTFTSTRFSGGKSAKKARQVKKAIKKGARDAYEMDQDEGQQGDRDFRYKVLKARAAYLKKI